MHSFPLSFCLSFISFLLIEGGGGGEVLLELEKTKTLEERERMEKEEKMEKREMKKKKKEGGQKLK